VRFCLRSGPKVWRAEWASVVGASNFLDFLVLFHQGKRTKKTGPHAVTSLSNTTGTLLPTTSQAVDYTAFNKASHIAQGNKDYFITYGPDRLRTKTSLQSGIGDDVLLTKYYAFGDFEKETDADGTRELHYIAGGDGLAAIYVKYDTGQDSLFYIMQDHLGSLVGAINAESDHVYRQSFDAWGRKRNPQDWSYNNIPDDFPFMRGYTSHENLKWFGLINMNGRMYDAGLCRFLSPDPYVQMPDNSQNFNRYSYCLNNPLVYTDPSGEFFFAAVGIGIFLNSMCWGATIGAVVGGVRAEMSGGKFLDGAWKGAAVGAVGGLMGPMGEAGMSFVENLGVGAIQGAFTGGLDAALWGTDIGKGMLWGAAGGAAFATLTSQNLKNLTKGEGFRTNSKVFDRMIASGKDKQAIIDFFGFEGEYIDEIGQSSTFQNSKTGEIGIRYRSDAFESYDALHTTYMKESYHLKRLADNNWDLADSDNFDYARWPEERLGVIHQYKNNGLCLNDRYDFLKAIRNTEYNINFYNNAQLYNTKYIYNSFQPKWWHFVYKIPRRW
jgi:RHS repeat-associated protein